MSEHGASISTDGQWARGITIFTYISGKLSVRNDLLEFTDTAGEVMFSFPIRDVKRVTFQMDRSMVLRTGHGNYTYYPYTPKHLSGMLGAFGGSDKELFQQMRKNQKENLPIARQWKAVFDQYGIPTNNPNSRTLSTLATINIIGYWFAVVVLILLIVGWVISLFRS